MFTDTRNHRSSWIIFRLKREKEIDTRTQKWRAHRRREMKECEKSEGDMSELKPVLEIANAETNRNLL